MKDVTKIDIAIIGGGIVGLWCAYEILSRQKNITLAIFEKEMFLGEHTSSRNSEVLHAGMYYENNSFKHIHCLEGNAIWREFSKAHGISILESGKIILSQLNDCDKLSKIFNQGKNNQVKGLHYLSRDKILELQKELNVESAFYSPTSAVLNVPQAIKSLSNLVENLGGIILKNHFVTIKEFGPESFTFSSGNEHINSKVLINAAGLFAIKIRSQLGLTEFSNKYVKGNYLTLKRPLPMNNLIYPIPPAHGLGLGVHLTLDSAGSQKFGPDTEEVTDINYFTSDDTVKKMLPDIKKIFKNVHFNDLIPGYSGIRPKILDSNLKIVKDFVIQSDSEHKIKGYYEFLGIESPGLTAAPSLAQFLSKKLTT